MITQREKVESGDAHAAVYQERQEKVFPSLRSINST
jgi:hypothetical protein